MLTDTAIKKAQPSAKPYRLTDERGLTLRVQPNGAKLWQLRYRHSGKERTASLGQYPDISLKEARERRDAVRKTVALGIDPVAEKRAQREAAEASTHNNFEAVTRQWWQQWHLARSKRHADYVLRRFPLWHAAASQLYCLLRSLRLRQCGETLQSQFGAMTMAVLAAVTPLSPSIFFFWPSRGSEEENGRCSHISHH